MCWLPESISEMLSRSPIEGHHAADYGHVHGNLGGHPSDEEHLLARLGMVGGVIQSLGMPQLLLCRTGRSLIVPGRKGRGRKGGREEGGEGGGGEGRGGREEGGGGRGEGKGGRGEGGGEGEEGGEERGKGGWGHMSAAME